MAKLLEMLSLKEAAIMAAFDELQPYANTGGIVPLDVLQTALSALFYYQFTFPANVPKRRRRIGIADCCISTAADIIRLNIDGGVPGMLPLVLEFLGVALERTQTEISLLTNSAN